MVIRPGVYFAFVQDEGVIMDLVQDRYYGLGPQSAVIWKALQQGLAPDRIAEAIGVGSPPQGGELVARQLEAWRDVNLVTAEAELPTELPQAKAMGTPALVALDQERISSAGFSWPLLIRLIRAQWWTRRVLHGRGICWVLKTIQDIPVATAQPSTRRDDVLYRMAHVYYSSRRLLMQGKDDCLPRSLALTAALRRLGVDADICFGVRKSPFSAHAWVETSGTVINETTERVEPYTIIARF
jgi:hypothetical protein